MEQFYLRFSQLGRLHPLWNPLAQGVQVLTDIPYLPTGSSFHTLDIYRPAHIKGHAPVVLYIHGGGFTMLSKESHWIMALMFARAGYVVFNINYTLAHEAPFPAAIEDSLHALKFVTRNAGLYKGNANRIILAGESAGANLALSVALAAKHDDVNNTLAHEIYALNPQLEAMMLGCGLFEVGHIERFRGKMPDVFLPVLEHISETYLGSDQADNVHRPLANPLSLLEANEDIRRALPPAFVFCGGADPILDDSLRLAAALKRRHARTSLRIYPGRHHAFHAFVPIDGMARDCWHDQMDFLERIAAGA
ncbi:MAG: alpha/beta hydrolase [Turneriella sp.]